MSDELRRVRREVRVLEAYAVLATATMAILVLAGFRSTHDKPHFEEIDVERLNIVEKNGTPRLILSNAARFPGLILHRREYPHPRRQAGMLFFNDEGTENGGLTTGVSRDSTGYRADGGLMFDQYEQDQTVGIAYSDDNGRRAAGLYVWDRPDVPILQLYRRVQEVRAMPEGAEKTRAMAELRAVAGRERVMVGKTRDSAATVVLSDAQGVPRLRFLVSAAGAARIEFLDSLGRVTRTISGHEGP
jgi:hypothetical protein